MSSLFDSLYSWIGWEYSGDGPPQTAAPNELGVHQPLSTSQQLSTARRMRVGSVPLRPGPKETTSRPSTPTARDALTGDTTEERPGVPVLLSLDAAQALLRDSNWSIREPPHEIKRDLSDGRVRGRLKVVIRGEAGVGKSLLLQRLVGKKRGTGVSYTPSEGINVDVIRWCPNAPGWRCPLAEAHAPHCDEDVSGDGYLTHGTLSYLLGSLLPSLDAPTKPTGEGTKPSARGLGIPASQTVVVEDGTKSSSLAPEVMAAVEDGAEVTTAQRRDREDVHILEIWDVVQKGVPKPLQPFSTSATSLADAVSEEWLSRLNADAAAITNDAENVDVYRNANAVILMFDENRRETFDFVRSEWRLVPPSVPVLIIANHGPGCVADANREVPAVTRAEVAQLCQEITPALSPLLVQLFASELRAQMLRTTTSKAAIRSLEQLTREDITPSASPLATDGAGGDGGTDESIEPAAVDSNYAWHSLSRQRRFNLLPWQLQFARSRGVPTHFLRISLFHGQGVSATLLEDLGNVFRYMRVALAFAAVVSVDRTLASVTSAAHREHRELAHLLQRQQQQRREAEVTSASAAQQVTERVALGDQMYSNAPPQPRAPACSGESAITVARSAERGQHHSSDPADSLETLPISLAQAQAGGDGVARRSPIRAGSAGEKQAEEGSQGAPLAAPGRGEKAGHPAVEGAPTPWEGGYVKESLDHFFASGGARAEVRCQPSTGKEFSALHLRQPSSPSYSGEAGLADRETGEDNSDEEELLCARETSILRRKLLMERLAAQSIVAEDPEGAHIARARLPGTDAMSLHPAKHEAPMRMGRAVMAPQGLSHDAHTVGMANRGRGAAPALKFSQL